MLGQFLVSILTRERPVDLLLIVIPPSGPCCQFVCQYPHICDPPASTLDICDKFMTQLVMEEKP